MKNPAQQVLACRRGRIELRALLSEHGVVVENQCYGEGNALVWREQTRFVKMNMQEFAQLMEAFEKARPEAEDLLNEVTRKRMGVSRLELDTPPVKLQKSAFPFASSSSSSSVVATSKDVIDLISPSRRRSACVWRAP